MIKKILITIITFLGMSSAWGMMRAGNSHSSDSNDEDDQWKQVSPRVAPARAGQAATSSSSAAASSASVPRPLGEGFVIPEIARGFEETYRRFLMGKLIYKPDPHSNEGRIDLLIRDLANPLEEEFDLSRCGDSERFLRINTGYRKEKKAANADTIEIWLALYPLIKGNLTDKAAGFQHIMGLWDPAVAPIGLFWTSGNWDEMDVYDYLITNSLEQLTDNNLHAKWISTDTLLIGAMRIPASPYKLMHTLSSFRWEL